MKKKSRNLKIMKGKISFGTGKCKIKIANTPCIKLAESLKDKELNHLYPLKE